MLHITGSVKTLKEELRSAWGLCKDIIGVLNVANANTNLTKEVGIFVIQMPEYKVLAKDAENAKKLLRRVCTGEIDPHEAARRFALAAQELYVISEKLK